MTTRTFWFTKERGRNLEEGTQKAYPVERKGPITESRESEAEAGKGLSCCSSREGGWHKILLGSK